MNKCLSVFISALVFAAALGASALPAQARGWGHVYVGGVGFDVAPYWFGWPGYAYPYPAYSYPVYPAPYAYSGYAETAVPAASPAPSTWYFCRSSGAYYPYASSCAEGWQQVPAVPPQ